MSTRSRWPFPASRFFHVMGEGWYVQMRHDATFGPFTERTEAQLICKVQLYKESNNGAHA